jgi:hypothetical protein
MLATFADRFRQQPPQAEIQRRLQAAGARPTEPSDWHGVKLGQAKPEELEAVLGNTILKEFKLRLERIGIDYQTPLRPA